MTIINVEPTPITVANGGTGAATLTAHGVLLGEGTSAVTATAAPTANQMLVGVASADPAPKTVAFFGCVLTGVAYKRVWGSNLSTGDNDLYTVPANKRALILPGQMFNSSAGTIACFAQVKISGTYYRLSSTSSPATGTAATSGMGIVLEAADIFSVNTATTNGLNIWFQVCEFDNTSNLKSARVTGLSTGDNTIYTCPANTSAWIVQSTLSGASGGLLPFIGSGSLNFVSDSGGTRNIIGYNVPSGGSSGTTNKVTASNAFGANTRGFVALGATITAGDFIVCNVDTGAAGQIAWVTVVESSST